MVGSLNPLDLVIWGGLFVGAIAVLKPEIINDLVGRELIPINTPAPVVVDTGEDDDEDPDRTDNTVADTSLPKSLKAVNFYAGKVAGLITVMAEHNIFSATQIKKYLLDKHIAQIEFIAQSVDFQTGNIDYANVIVMREIAKVCIDVSKELHIQYKISETVALEVIAGLGRGFANLPPTQNQGIVVENVLRFLSNRFNGAPEIKFTGESSGSSSNSNFAMALSSVRVSNQRVLNVFNTRRLF